MFWYLLSDAGLIKEKRDELRNDEALKIVYQEKFNKVYGLGLINIIRRLTRDVTKLKKNEELPGCKKITRIIDVEAPKVVCFIGKSRIKNILGERILLLAGKTLLVNPAYSSCTLLCAVKRLLGFVN